MYDRRDVEHERFFVESVESLKKVNKKIAKLIVQKEELTQQIIIALEHDHEGQKTYEYGVWKIEVKTPYIYSLNKKLYESGAIQLPDAFNPIKQSIAYTVDKRLLDQYVQEAPEEVRDALVELIDKKPGKAGISIKEIS